MYQVQPLLLYDWCCWGSDINCMLDNQICMYIYLLFQEVYWIYGAHWNESCSRNNVLDRVIEAVKDIPHGWWGRHSIDTKVMHREVPGLLP